MAEQDHTNQAVAAAPREGEIRWWFRPPCGCTFRSFEMMTFCRANWQAPKKKKSGVPSFLWMDLREIQTPSGDRHSPFTTPKSIVVFWLSGTECGMSLDGQLPCHACACVTPLENMGQLCLGIDNTHARYHAERRFLQCTLVVHRRAVMEDCQVASVPILSSVAPLFVYILASLFVAKTRRHFLNMAQKKRIISFFDSKRYMGSGPWQQMSTTRRCSVP